MWFFLRVLHTLSIGARKMETPVRANTKMPVIRCSLYIGHWWNIHMRLSSQFHKPSLYLNYKGLSRLFICEIASGSLTGLSYSFSYYFCVLWFYITVDQPDPEELRLLSGSTRRTLHLQRVDVSDGDDGGSDVPGQAHEGAGGHQDAHPEQIQVVATAFLPGKPDADHFYKYKTSWGWDDNRTVIPFYTTLNTQMQIVLLWLNMSFYEDFLLLQW